MSARPGIVGAALLAIVALGALAGAALAHIVPVGVGIQMYVRLDPKHFRLEYNLGFSDFAGYSEVLKMESNRDGILSEEEIQAWLEALKPRILAGLDLRLDDKPLAVRLTKCDTLGLFPGTDVTKIPGLPFDTNWYLDADVDLGPGEHTVKLYDHNYEKEISQSLTWFSKNPTGGPYELYAWETDPKEARQLEMGFDIQCFARGATLYFAFAPAAYRALEAAAAPTATAAVTVTATTGSAGMRAVAEAAIAAAATRNAAVSATATIAYRGAEELVEQERMLRLRDEIWYLAIGLALVYGAAHALAPGHGKSMIAAHLLGSQGRIVDAISLGGIVTFTHSAGNFAIAVAVILLAEKVFGVNANTMAGRSAITLEVLAGAMVFLIGVGLLYRRVQAIGRARAPDHHHDHDHDHAHGDHGHSHGLLGHHHHGPGRGAPEGLLSLGFWAGFQPCTAGIALTFFSINQGWLWKGLYLLVAFSAGLGLVIVAIAVAMVSARSLVADRLDVEKSPLFKALPVVSAAFLTCIGAWMVIDCLMRNKIGPFAHT